jgi:hypothetical protein
MHCAPLPRVRIGTDAIATAKQDNSPSQTHRKQVHQCALLCHNGALVKACKDGDGGDGGPWIGWELQKATIQKKRIWLRTGKLCTGPVKKKKKENSVRGNEKIGFFRLWRNAELCMLITTRGANVDQPSRNVSDSRLKVLSPCEILSRKY